MTKILLVDHEPINLRDLNLLFGDAGYDTTSASDGKAGLQEFFTSRPNIAIVDVLLPYMDGFELCRRIREISYIPIIIWSGAEEAEVMIRAFNAGASDYLVKPVSGTELIARVKARMHRFYWPPVTEAESVYSDCHLRVAFNRREVYVDGEVRELTPIEYSLLSLLIQNPGEVLSLAYLLKSVWGQEYDTSDLVRWHISNLRRKLENNQGQRPPIVTIRSYGYLYDPQRTSKDISQ